MSKRTKISGKPGHVFDDFNVGMVESLIEKEEYILLAFPNETEHGIPRESRSVSGMIESDASAIGALFGIAMWSSTWSY